MTEELKNGEYKIGVEHRLKGVEDKLDSLDKTVAELKDNHIHAIETKMDRFSWLVITTLITVIIGLVMIFFKR